MDVEKNNNTPAVDLSGWTNPDAKKDAPASPAVDLSGWSGEPKQTATPTTTPTTTPEPKGTQLLKGYSDPISGLASALETIPSRAIHDTAQAAIDIGQAAYTKITGKPVERYSLDGWDKLNHQDVGVEKGSISDQIADMGTWFVGFGAASKALKMASKGEELTGVYKAVHSVVAGGLADFTMGDPYHEKLADLAYSLTKNSADPSSAFTQMLNTMRTDKNGSALDERFKNVGEGAVLGLITDGAMGFISKVYSETAKLAATGDKQGAADALDALADHMNKASGELEDSIEPTGVITKEAQTEIATKEEQSVTDYDPKKAGGGTAVEEHIDDLELMLRDSSDASKKPKDIPRARQRKPVDGEKEPLNDSLYKGEGGSANLRAYIDTLKEVHDSRTVLTGKAMRSAFNRLVRRSQNSQAVYDTIKMVSKRKGVGAEDGAFAQYALQHARKEADALRLDGVRGHKMIKALNNIYDMAQAEMKAGQTYGQGMVHIKLARDLADGKEFDELAKMAKDMGMSQDSIDALGKNYAKIAKRVNTKQEKYVEQLRVEGYTRDERAALLKVKMIDIRKQVEKDIQRAEKGSAIDQLTSKAKLIQSELMLNNPTTAGTSLVSGYFQSYYRPLVRMMGGALGLDMKQVRQGAYMLYAINKYMFTTDNLAHAIHAIKEGKGAITEAAEDEFNWTYAMEATGKDSLPIWTPALRLYTGMDEWFKLPNYKAAVATQFREENREMLAGLTKEERDKAIQDHVESMIEDGHAVDETLREYARETTFSQNIKGDSLAYIEDLAHKFPKLSMLFLPFVHTPFNILRFAIKQTPLGLASSSLRDVFHNGTKQQKREIAAAWVLWTGVSGWLTHKLLAGEATAGYASDPKLRQAQMDSGRPQYGIKIGDTWVSVEKGDFSIPLKIALNVADAYQNGLADDKDHADIAMDSFAASVKGILDNSMLTGLSQLMSAAQAKDGGRLTTLIAGYGTRVVPPSYTKLAQTLTGKSDIQEALTLQEKILRKAAPWKLSDRLDWLTGKPVNFAPNVLGWKYNSDKDIDIVHQRISAVGGINPISNNLTNGIPLDGEQKSRLTQLMTTAVKDARGRTMYQAIKELTETKLWHLLPTDRHGLGGSNWQQTQVQNIVNVYKNVAEIKLEKEYPALKEQLVERQKALLELKQAPLLLSQAEEAEDEQGED